MDVGYYSPSYKRAETACTHKYLPFIKYVIAESEAEEYKKRGLPCWVVPDKAQGSVSRIRNYILDNAEEKIVMFDDDMSGIYRWQNQKAKKLNSDEVQEFCEHGFILADDLGVVSWGVNLTKQDKSGYRECTPFSMVAMILGPFQAFNNIDLRYDEELPLKEDYDLSIQVLNKYRKTLRFNNYYYQVKQHTNIGGCAYYRSLEREKEQMEKLIKKWGSKIVQIDKTSKGYDLNPIIKIPIKGV